MKKEVVESADWMMKGSVFEKNGCTKLVGKLATSEAAPAPVVRPATAATAA